MSSLPPPFLVYSVELCRMYAKHVISVFESWYGNFSVFYMEPN